MKAEIIADSLNPVGKRLTTWILEYPRFVHAEFMTHRMFSKNAASSRAIPIEKMIQQIRDNPAMPVWWGKNQSGMQAKEELEDTSQDYRMRVTTTQDAFAHITHVNVSARAAARYTWLQARDQAIEQVMDLMKIGLHKQIANRILEPWFNIRIIMSATEMENYFALRAHPDAQPEIQELAYKMLELYNASVPKKLLSGEWHIPFGDKIDQWRLYDAMNVVYPDTASSLSSDLGFKLISSMMPEYQCEAKDMVNLAKMKVAIARCARISYLNFEGKDDYAADIKLCDRLFGSTPRHLSPTEHVAQALDSKEFIGNFSGFKQYRYSFKDQNLGDDRVAKSEL